MPGASALVLFLPFKMSIDVLPNPSHNEADTFTLGNLNKSRAVSFPMPFYSAAFLFRVVFRKPEIMLCVFVWLVEVQKVNEAHNVNYPPTKDRWASEVNTPSNEGSSF